MHGHTNVENGTWAGLALALERRTRRICTPKWVFCLHLRSSAQECRGTAATSRAPLAYAHAGRVLRRSTSQSVYLLRLFSTVGFKPGGLTIPRSTSRYVLFVGRYSTYPGIQCGKGRYEPHVCTYRAPSLWNTNRTRPLFQGELLSAFYLSTKDDRFLRSSSSVSFLLSSYGADATPFF